VSTASSPSEFDDSFPEKDLELPEDLREELSKPIGRFVSAWALGKCIDGAPKVVTVGDVVTMTLLKMGLRPDVAVFDYKTQRAEDYGSKERISKMEGRLVKVNNPPAKITVELWRAVREALRANDKVKIEVSGEEDLAALAAIINAPEGAQVIYGIPNRGMMVVDVNDETRALASAAVKRMIR
jgi:uncharacterized protein (UPF0218 family)